MRQRVLTAILALMLFLPIVIIGGLTFTFIIYVLASVALFELLRMKRLSLLTPPGLLSLLLLWVLLLPNTYIQIINVLDITKVELVLVSVLLFLTYTVVTKNKFTFDDAGFVILATIYIGMGFYYFLEIRDTGLVYIFFAMFVIFATDSGAYFVGRAFGKTKLWPDISPNKTIEGFIGGVFSALLVAILYQLFVQLEETMSTILIITILLSIFGQIGDLVESALKRHYSVKDSGEILPGHGGILDRFDSLLFVLPILYFLQLL